MCLFMALDAEEMTVFDDMKASCDRNVKKLDSSKGCKTFAKAWNTVAASRCKQKLDGHEEVAVVNRKSCAQLQSHCDLCQKREELRRLQSKKDPLMEQMEAAFRSTRGQSAQHQGVAQCQPLQCNNHNVSGHPFCGVPFALNPETAVNAFQCNQLPHQDAAMLCRQPTSRQERTCTRQALGGTFKARTHCWKCGHQRKTHIRLGIPFGDDCHSNCLFDECSKCGWRMRDHHKNNVHGPRCDRPIGSSSKVAGEWHKQRSALHLLLVVVVSSKLHFLTLGCSLPQTWKQMWATLEHNEHC